ncbi:LysR family transcriptional regulator [Propioniferax innocua]|uniref:DNA-binding transcriptional LysR family regulator n=1 Tax=Propioniferax innocua TaxID=1753 RepID=A0A542ZPR1_9ACTN|nr:LysR family transcriptional regulator [Propioniferax innocua]TQL62354.1 DNA-binding transcriptional LysR family regulator [Propioniferax innocua]
MGQMPELIALKVLVAVADHGSMSAAAREVGMAQPNASRSLSTLERRLGLRLLNRSTTGSVPTPEGYLVVEWARQVLDEVDALVANATALHDADGGRLSVVASQTIAEHLLPGWLTRFRSVHPEVQLQVGVENTDGVLAQLHSGACEIGFIEGPLPHGSAHAQIVAHDELVLVVSPDHRWAQRDEPIAAEQLLDGILITRESGSGTRRVLDDALPHPVTPQMELNSNTAVRVAVTAGAGPAVLSHLAVRDALRAGQLIALPVAGASFRRPLRAVWSGPQHLGEHATTLVRLASERG